MRHQHLLAAILGTALSFGTCAHAADIDFESLKHRTTDTSAPVVYYTSDLSPEGLMKAYTALGRELQGKVAVKLSSGEAGNNHYLQPALIKELVQKYNGTIVECNTAYGGSRNSTAAHRQVMIDNGFAAIAPTDIMDAEGEMEIPVTGGSYLTNDIVGASLKNYDSMMVLSHFKGHAMGGFGGALKNISIGVASSHGKGLIHSGGDIRPRPEGADRQQAFIECMAEAADAVSDYFDHGQSMTYVNVMNNLSVDCDCDSHPAAPDMHDVGTLASLDPVALDQACVDTVYAAPDGHSLIERMESRRGALILDHAEKMGLGHKNYQFVSLDEK